MDQAELLTEGIRQFERWRATRVPADLQSAIALFAELDARVPADSPLRFWADVLYATALADRYALSDSVDDIDVVIERLKRVLADPSPPPGVGRDEIDAYRVALGRALSNRIDMYGRPGGPPPASDAEFLAELRTAVDELAVAATTSSALVTPAERAEAATLRAHLVPKLALARGIVGRKGGELADIPELERVLRELSAGHPNRGHILLELGFAHMHLLLQPGVGSSLRTSEHRVPAQDYLSQGVELLEPDYPERAKAIVFLAYLAVTQGSDSPEAVTSSVRELTRLGLESPGLDPEVSSGLRLLATMSARSGGTRQEFAAAAAVSQLGTFRGLLSSPMASSPSLDDQDARDITGQQFLRLLAEHGLLEESTVKVRPRSIQIVELPALRSLLTETAGEPGRGEAEDEDSPPFEGLDSPEAQSASDDAMHRQGKQSRAPVSVMPGVGEGISHSPPRTWRMRATWAFRWILPPASLAVLQASHEALSDDAQRFVEAELDRAYAALGPPPGLNERT